MANPSSRELDILLVLIITFITACGISPHSLVNINTDGNWDSLGLEGLEIHSVITLYDKIYVGTETGIYMKSASNSDWSFLGPKNAEIRDFVVFTEEEILAPSYFAKQDSNTIARTIDGGENWHPFRNGYDPIYGTTPVRLVRKPHSDTLFGTYNLPIAMSTDRGKNWRLVYKDWGSIGSARFVHVDKSYPDVIWSGGANAAFQPYVVQSNNKGKTWSRISFDGVGSEAIVFDIEIHPQRADHVLAGLSSGFSGKGIYISYDNGSSWDQTYDKSSIRSLIRSPRNGHIVYASGVDETNTLWFIVSPDFGKSWEKITGPRFTASVRVNDISVIQIEGKETLVLVTNAGVYSYQFNRLIP